MNGRWMLRTAVAAAVLGVGGTAARAGQELSLAGALEVALRSSPALHLAGAEVDAASARFREARASRLPQLTARQSFVRSNNPVFVFGSLLEQGRFSESDFALDALNAPAALSNFRSEVALRAPVFDALQSGVRIEQAGLGREQAAWGAELAAQRIRLEVIRAYYGVLVAERAQEVATESVRSAESDVERVRQMFGTGLVVESDLLAAEVQLAEFHQREIQASGDAQTASAALSTVLGQPVQTRYILTETLREVTAELPQESELVEQALRRRADLSAAGAGRRAAAAGVRGARAQVLPRLGAFASYGRSSEDLFGGSGDATVGAHLDLSLFEPGRRARLEQARAQERLAWARHEALAGQIRFEVVQAYQRHRVARDRLAVAARAVDRAIEALRIVQDRYQEGLTTITEVLRAETALLSARMSLLAARYDQHVGYAELLLASGALTAGDLFDETGTIELQVGGTP
jgi:outer membrane protein